MIKYFAKTGCIVLLLLVTTLQAMAQTTTGGLVIRGKITDRKNREPIHGASVSEVDADGRILKGVATDLEGNFVIKITNSKNKLSVSYVGYKTVTQGINGRSSINFQVEQGASADLEEAIVVAARKIDNGMGSISEKDLTTAVARIAAKDLEEMQAASIDQALQGRLSGCRYYRLQRRPRRGHEYPHPWRVFYKFYRQSTDSS